MNDSPQPIFISNFKNSIGITLVLFILLVIVANVFYSPFRQGNPVQDEDLSTLGSVSVYVKNGTGSYVMNTTSLTGDFEPPGPSPHTIQSGGQYRFEILTKSHASATASYNITSANGELLGTATIKMGWAGSIVFRYGTATATVTGPFKAVKEDSQIVRIDRS
ncbi:hypothetical protein M3223_08925 [Paenibacillus pasadenensis]|uniref:hypothetical protein n=1 Tax=Paenibacillus pasadenensis TaxID=217090 RepID=UPI00203D48EB|nr:hypothetical protein [Paenibacillus pasadenensis]MCM3747476.1 hypothetical protein [Paenibacillus pasadenensis]